MSEQQTTEKEAIEKEVIVRFTVDMPESMHYELSLLAVKYRQPKAVLVRLAIEQMLRDMSQEVLS